MVGLYKSDVPHNYKASGKGEEGIRWYLDIVFTLDETAVTSSLLVDVWRWTTLLGRTVATRDHVTQSETPSVFLSDLTGVDPTETGSRSWGSFSSVKRITCNQHTAATNSPSYMIPYAVLPQRIRTNNPMQQSHTVSSFCRDVTGMEMNYDRHLAQNTWATRNSSPSHVRGFCGLCFSTPYGASARQ